ncbi:MAG: hypothetical protein HQ510_07780 [Candidatus Marinimicrobia bacterium]|nr:hypothetical protein [Candidatus Neomarinimicrobiota bacterium]
MNDTILNFAHHTFDLVSNLDFCKKYPIDRNRELKIRSALYVIQDTQLVINLYLVRNINQVAELSNHLEKKAMNYLIVYGILHALYMQQDALISLCEAFDIFNKSVVLENKSFAEIRKIRNSSTGHPSNRRDEGKSFISQMSVGQYYFQYVDVKGGESELVDVDIKSLAQQQVTEISIFLEKIANRLSDMENKL